MSAGAATAAAALPRSRPEPAHRQRANPLPPWMAGIPWTAVPTTFLEQVARCLTPSAYQILALLLRETIGRPDRADWCERTQAQIAAFLGFHVNTVAAAIRELKEERLIAAERAEGKRGRGERYRLLPENWHKARPRLKEPVEESTVKPVEESTVEPVEESTVEPEGEAQVVRIAAGKAKPVTLSTPATRFRCHNRSSLAIDISTRLNGDVLDLEITLLDAANTGRTKEAAAVGSPVDKAQVNAAKATPDCGKSPEGDLRALLNRGLAEYLGPVAGDTVSLVLEALRGAPISQLEARILSRLRMFTSAQRSWGGVIVLAREVGQAFAIAQAQGGASEAPLVDDSNAGISQQAEQQAKEELANPFIDEEWRREILKAHPGLRHWQPSDAEVKQAVTVEARRLLRSLAMTHPPLPAGLKAEYRAALARIRARFPEAVAAVEAERAR